MSTQQLALLIIAVLVVGGGAWVLLQPSDEQQSATDTEQRAEAESADETGEIAPAEADGLSGADRLVALMELGRDVQCYFESEAPDGTSSSGTFYTDQERFRIDATSMSEGEETISHMINNDANVYLWGETPEGMMGMMFASENLEPTDTDGFAVPENADGSYVDVDQEVRYDCTEWSVNAAVFTPPSDVEFTDMNAMMEGMMQNMPEGFAPPQQ